jgi:hypothetical protein
MIDFTQDSEYIRLFGKKKKKKDKKRPPPLAPLSPFK